MKKPILSILFSCLLSTAFAQFSFNNFDINPSGDSDPRDLVNYNGKLYFAASTPATGDELWVSDGTIAGTKLVADIAAGTSSSSPNSFTELNGKLMFFANPYSLYSTDGTTAGTQLIATLTGAPPSSYGQVIAKLGNKMYFAAGIDVNELWETDGTPTGTNKIAVFAVSARAPSAISTIRSCYGQLYISATTSATEKELWVSDGTTAGTVLLKDINPGPAGSDPRLFTEFKNKVYFAAHSNGSGRELWETDGTQAGTKQVTDLVGSSSGLTDGYFFLKVYNNELYFNGYNSNNLLSLFKTDGTTAGTTMVHQLYNTPSGNNLIVSSTEYKGKLYFAAQGFDSSGIWYTDGTTAGTVNITTNLLKDNFADRLIIYNSKLYFSAFNTPSDYMLYYTDGTVAGTKMLNSPGALPNPLMPQPTFGNFTVANGYLFFGAAFTATGNELWALKDSSLSIVNSNAVQAPHITLYPNPAHHNFTIKTTTAFTNGNVTLTDVTGRVVMTKKLYTNKQTIPLQGIAPGMYIVDIWLDDKRSTQKLVIE